MPLAPTPWALRASALALAALALVLAGVVARDAIGFVGRPWAGFGMLPDGAVAPLTLSPLRLAHAVRALRFGDRVVAVDGVAVDGAAARTAVERVGPGVPLRYTVQGQDGELHDVVVPTATFTASDYVELFLPFLVGGLFGVGIGLLAVLARPDLTATRLFFLINLGLAVNFGFLAPDAYLVHHLPRWGFLAAGLMLGTLGHFALLVPVVRPPLRSHPRATLATIYGLAAIETVLLGARARAAIPLMAAYVAAALVAGSANLALAAARAPDIGRRLQARVVLVGLVPLVAAGALFIVSNLGWAQLHLPVVAYLVPLWFFGGCFAYAMLAHNFLDLDVVVRRSLSLGILAGAAVAVYLGLFAAIERLVDPTTAWAVAGLAAAVLATVVPAVAPVRRAVEGAVERALFPGQRAARELIHAASRELARLRDEDELVRFLRDAVARGVSVAGVRLVAGPRRGPVVEIAPAPGDSRLALSANDPLVALLARGGDARAARATSPAQRAAVARAQELGAELIVPLPPSPTHVAGLLLRRRDDGRPYGREDERLLETLAAQAAVALENARAWEEVRRLEQRLAAENLYLREEVQQAHDVTGIVGQGPGLRGILAQIEQVAPTDATVLVCGETGTGKELVVHAIHAASRRRERALVKIACAALPEQLLESELFGYERGAFTGASGRKPGRFEVADGGTIFFDDVDTLPIGVQAKLLRALQEREVQRLGSNEVRTVDVRVVAATNRDLLAEVQAGRFREDLYYRLNVVPIHVPPLRQRPEDIPLLVEHFVRQDGPHLGRSVRAVSAEALDALRAYPWPGNVRELRNVIQRALVLSRDDVLRLPGPLAGAGAAASAARDAGDPAAPLAEQVRELKVRLIRGALATSGGNQRIAAEQLGLHRQSLTRMIRDLGLQERPERGQES